jgi:hypothetical protein
MVWWRAESRGHHGALAGGIHRQRRWPSPSLLLIILCFVRQFIRLWLSLDWLWPGSWIQIKSELEEYYKVEGLTDVRVIRDKRTGKRRS